MSVCTSAAKPASTRVTPPTMRYKVQDVRRQGEQAVGTGDQVDTGGYHGGGVDQCRYRGRAGHRVRQPGLQRQLRGFTHGAAQQHQGRQGDPEVADLEFLRCQHQQFLDIQRAHLVGTRMNRPIAMNTSPMRVTINALSAALPLLRLL